MASRRGYKPSEETKNKIRIANTGHRPSKETRLKMGAIHKGQIPWNKGKRYSTQTHADIAKKWVANNKERRLKQARKSHLKIKFGITPEDYQALFDKQNGKCAICKEPHKALVDKLNRPHPNLYIDHCHKSGAIRGLLCMGCNTGLGHFKDSPELLEKAIKYLYND